MLRTFKGEKFCCGLDLGVQTLKVALVRSQDSENLELLGVHEVKTVGIKDASISDLNGLADCIQRAVSGLTQKTGSKIRHLHIGMGGDLVTVRESSAVIPLLEKGNKVINHQDVNRVKLQARLLGIQLEEEILHDFSRYYKVDDVNTAVNPVGLYGRKLGANFLLVITHLTRMRNIAKAVNQAGFEMGQAYFSSYAASQVALDKKAKADGVAFIDVGSTSTAVLIYQDGLLQHVELIPWGGLNVSQSIAVDLNLTMDLAEEIKKSHAVAQKSIDETDEEILVKRETGYMPIQRSKILRAIEPEVEKFAGLIQKAVKQSPLYHQLNAGIVIVGGGSLLPGLIERIEQESGIPVATGVPTKGLNNSAMYAGVIGLAQMNAINALQAVSVELPGRWTTRLSNSFKELYQEYF